MPSDEKITIDLEVNDSGAKSAIDDISREASHIPDFTINIKAVDQASSVIEGVSQKAAKVSGGTSEITANDEASAAIDAVSQKADNVSGGTAQIDANTEDAETKIDSVEQKANEASGTVTINGNAEDAEAAISDVEQAERAVGRQAGSGDRSREDRDQQPGGQGGQAQRIRGAHIHTGGKGQGGRPATDRLRAQGRELKMKMDDRLYDVLKWVVMIVLPVLHGSARRNITGRSKGLAIDLPSGFLRLRGRFLVRVSLFQFESDRMIFGIYDFFQW